MSHFLSQELKNKLNSFAQRKLLTGEIFLLAKALAEQLPLAPADTDNIVIYNLNYKNLINEVIFALNSFTYVSDEEAAIVSKLINELSLWRFNIAHNPPATFYTGDTNTVVDDTTGILRYVDVVYICAVADIIESANYMLSVFKDLVNETNLHMNAHKQ